MRNMPRWKMIGHLMAALAIWLTACAGEPVPPEPKQAGESITFEQWFRATDICFHQNNLDEDDKVYAKGCASKGELELVVQDGVVEAGRLDLFGGDGLILYDLPFLLPTLIRSVPVLGSLNWSTGDVADSNGCFNGEIEPDVNFNDSYDDDLAIELHVAGRRGTSTLQFELEIMYDVVASGTLRSFDGIHTFLQGFEPSVGEEATPCEP